MSSPVDLNSMYVMLGASGNTGSNGHAPRMTKQRYQAGHDALFLDGAGEKQ
jgi:hypothetical protein